METNDSIRIASYRDRMSVPIVESGEEMVNITQGLKNCVCMHERDDMLKYTGADIWVRKTVAEKLQVCGDSLQKIHPTYKLKIVYGFRHPEIQTFYFERRKELLRPDNLGLSEEELEELADTMSANPKAAGHPTGGCVDITITSPDGDLDMGTGISDFSDPEKVKTFCDYINEEQMKNRMLLRSIMVAEEFFPYDGEWWHYGYGDREWAWYYGKPNAIYDQIDFRR